MKNIRNIVKTLQNIMRYLKDAGRAAIVLPDGSLTGDGVKTGA